MSTAPAAPAGTRRVGPIVTVLAFGGIVVSLMQTLVIPLVADLPTLLSTTASAASWVITSTLLASAVSTPVIGRLGDMFGKRRMLLVSVAMMVLGSVVCAFSSTLVPMVVGRTLQGLSSAVIPLGISVMRDELPARRLGSATALMSASLGIGGALGLPAAAFIAEHASWHALFWTSAGLGVLVAVGVIAVVPVSTVRSGGRVDVVGVLGLSTGLVCLLLAISNGAEWGWGSALTIGLFVASVLVLVVWAWWELRVRLPLVDLRTSARRPVLLTNVASVVFGFAMFAMSLVLPQLLETPAATGYGLGQSMLVAGLCVGPSGLVMMAVAPLSARILTAAGGRTTLMIGALVVAVGYGIGVLLLSAIWQLVLIACVIGAGIGFAYAAMPSLIMSAVPVTETAAANSLNSLMRSLGTAFSSAVAGVLLSQLTIRFGPAVLPSLTGFRVVMASGCGAALIALVIAAFLPTPARLAAAPSAAAPALTEVAN